MTVFEVLLFVGIGVAICVIGKCFHELTYGMKRIDHFYKLRRIALKAMYYYILDHDVRILDYDDIDVEYNAVKHKQIKHITIDTLFSDKEVYSMLIPYIAKATLNDGQYRKVLQIYCRVHHDKANICL